MNDCDNRFLKPKILSIPKYLVEQAPSPAKYSRGWLFYMMFAAVSGPRFRLEE